MRLRRVAAFSYARVLQLAAARVLSQSWLLEGLTYAQAWVLILAGFVQLRGLVCKNPLQQLYTGDLLGLGPVLSIRAAWPSFVNRQGPQTLWRASRETSEARDTPAYLEVDELCASVVILVEPRTLFACTAKSGVELPFLTLKCYN